MKAYVSLWSADLLNLGAGERAGGGPVDALAAVSGDTSCHKAIIEP